MAETLFDKIWKSHSVSDTSNGDTILYIDRITMHERTGTIALNALANRDITPRHPSSIICVMDHIVDTRPGRSDATPVPGGEAFISSTRNAAEAFGLRLFDLDDQAQGISHLVSAEQAFVLPGLTLVCPDSHTCTLGALGALAFGIGTGQAEQAIATSTLTLAKPGNMRVTFTGKRTPGVYAKDLALHLISREGAGAANGRAVEYAGEAIDDMGVEERMTLCNMAVEFSAFTAIIAPDESTFNYIEGKPGAPVPLPRDRWSLKSDDGAVFDIDIVIDVASIKPQVTWGTSPEHATAVTGTIPESEQGELARVFEYIDLQPGQQLADVKIDTAYIGSCTNARLSDLRIAASVLKGRRIARHVKALCVPGSKLVKRQAEAEGLDRVFKAAGFEWREPGCGLCFYAGGEHLGQGKRAISTTNRNFEGRQGPGVKTHLASPATVAASAIRGRIASADMLELAG